jgi:hypothetical protein
VPFAAESRQSCQGGRVCLHNHSPCVDSSFALRGWRIDDARRARRPADRPSSRGDFDVAITLAGAAEGILEDDNQGNIKARITSLYKREMLSPADLEHLEEHASDDVLAFMERSIRVTRKGSPR